MSCGEAREKLPLYVGGDLDAEVLEGVRTHLESCAPCALLGSEALRARRELVSAFRQPAALSATPGLWPGIRATLRAEGLIRERSEPARLPAAPARARRPHWAWALVPVAAAAALLLVLQLGNGFERAPKALPIADVPANVPVSVPGANVELVSAPAVTGGLRKLEPDQVRPLRAFQPRQETIAPGGDASLAGFRGAK
jgi:putative zinc finger protein